MTVREAKEFARDWVLRSRSAIPNLVGAFVPGSIGYLRDEEPHPPSSDVDLSLLIDGPVPDLFMEPEHPPRPQKILHNGALLDTLAQPLAWFRDVQGIVGRDTRAPDLARMTPILDPHGRLPMCSGRQPKGKGSARGCAGASCQEYYGSNASPRRGLVFSNTG